jgi:hypothetical protein
MKTCDAFGEMQHFGARSDQPIRSRLFSLTPIRLGEPMQESLRSFLIRTSRAHSVSPRRLILEILSEVDPEAGRQVYPGFFRRFSKTINGIGQYAKQFASALEKTTCITRLDRLTMLPWQGMFPHNGQGMLAEHPRWCPTCLMMQCLESGERYIPLAWALEGFTACPIHGRRLESCCPHCGKRQAFIPRYPDVGICSECGEPLVTREVLLRHADRPTDSERWAAEAIGRMIAHHAATELLPVADDFRAFVAAQVAHAANGNRAAFCRMAGLRGRALDGWLAKGERPSMSQLLVVCHRLCIQPTELAKPGNFLVSFSPNLVSTWSKSRNRCPRLPAWRRQEIRSLLAACQEDDECASLSRIAGQIGVSARYLRYWFPDMCNALSVRHRAAEMATSSTYRAKQGARVQEVVRQVQDAGEYPSRRRVNGVLRNEGMSLAQPHLLLAYRDALKINEEGTP